VAINSKLFSQRRSNEKPYGKMTLRVVLRMVELIGEA
jgi:hypothetical protein